MDTKARRLSDLHRGRTSGVQQLYVARRRSSPDGRFNGVILISDDLELISRMPTKALATVDHPLFWLAMMVRSLFLILTMFSLGRVRLPT